MTKTDKNKSVIEAYRSLYRQAVESQVQTDGTLHITIGTATCGRAAGALDTLDALRDEIGRRGIDAVITETGCRGYCYAEPLVTISRPDFPPILYGYVTPGVAARLVSDFIAGDDPCLEFALGALEENELVPAIYDQPRFQYETRNLLRRCGEIDPGDIDQHIAGGGYGALAKALGMTPQRVIDEIGSAGLRGLGGAGFPAAAKWRVCRDTQSDIRYVICNADEGDPGAFMDRTILESDPHSVIEGMAIAAHAVGAAKGYVYVRAEYPLAVERIERAIEGARSKGLLGSDILGSGFGFDIEVFHGAGAFVCGEATALIASIEGRRGWPRHRPPRTAVSGLWDKPTLINNVKTFAYVPHIIDRGAAWLSDIGTDASKGTAVFALAGKVLNTGLTEVPMGTTLRRVVFDIGGGIPHGRRFKAVQIGGPSGGCLPEEMLDTPVDFDSLTGAGAMMGSGGMVILDEDNCMVDTARYFLEFTRNESCGKCTFCRLGTAQMLDILENIADGRGKPDDLALLEELSSDVKAGSLCGLGQSAPNPVLTTLRYFRDEYEAHIIDKRCPAKVCPELTAFYILPDKCERSCDACVGTCPTDAIFSGKHGIKVIDQEKCVKCGTCVDACPPQYKAIVRISPISELPPSEPRPAGKKNDVE
ncbi:MAG: NADH-ubiquinone oxidoreductase-F iron-sulfur binding region domain-containing protein [Chloroflexota bacterium]|nr:NADH-ubiquinone oxidoreductase-F iron-sulfur binding region domain-containing protein [Chloroflexota bacterium]